MSTNGTNGNGHAGGYSEFSVTQQKMLNILADGSPHTREELLACCREGSHSDTVAFHLCKARKILATRGEDVVCCIVHRRICYRHMRVLASPYRS